MKRLLKSLLSERARMRVRRLGRLRWLTKARVVRTSGESPLRWWRYVLWDPEVDSFTYRIANEDELVAYLAELVDRPAGEIAGYVDELHTDPRLDAALRPPWRHLLWSKRRLEPTGPHIAMWAIVRALRPEQVVETGILDGMSSVVMLAALERNASEGHPGRLLSCDVMPNAGALVPEWLWQRWEKVIEDSATALPRLLAGRRVGLFVSDSLPDAAHVRKETEAVMAHPAAELVLVSIWGDLGAFESMGLATSRFKERPRDHFYKGSEFAACRFQPAS